MWDFYRQKPYSKNLTQSAQKTFLWFFLLAVVNVFLACAPPPDEADTDDDDDDVVVETNAPLASGDIIVSTAGTGAVIALESDGTYKRTLYEPLVDGNINDRTYGLHWDSSTRQLYVAVEYTLGRKIIVVDGDDYSLSVLTADVVGLSAALRGMSALSGGDLLVAVNGGTKIERYTTAGVRITAGWPLTAVTGVQDVDGTTDGGLLVCGGAANTVQKRNSAGAVTSSTTYTGGTAVGCLELSGGNVAVAWQHATAGSDRVRVYNSTLGSIVTDFSNSFLTNPVGVAQKPDGNLLVVESPTAGTTGFFIIEFTLVGAYVDRYGGALLANAQYLQVIP